ncbi:hypothetical protein [Algivirga pacifica]|uniref:PKD domain-containing protein n=1 Tax=Algivirga pacifica TaxID=1162670 RepID=A0ABP9DGL7_9BACT
MKRILLLFGTCVACLFFSVFGYSQEKKDFISNFGSDKSTLDITWYPKCENDIGTTAFKVKANFYYNIIYNCKTSYLTYYVYRNNTETVSSGYEIKGTIKNDNVGRSDYVTFDEQTISPFEPLKPGKYTILVTVTGYTDKEKKKSYDKKSTSFSFEVGNADDVNIIQDLPNEEGIVNASLGGHYSSVKWWKEVETEDPNPGDGDPDKPSIPRRYTEREYLEYDGNVEITETSEYHYLYNSNGCTQTGKVFIVTKLPTPSFSYTIQECSNGVAEVKLTPNNIFTGEFSEIPDNIDIRYTWDFGEGTVAEQTNGEVTHSYNIQGIVSKSFRPKLWVEYKLPQDSEYRKWEVPAAQTVQLCNCGQPELRPTITLDVSTNTLQARVNGSDSFGDLLWLNSNGEVVGESADLPITQNDRYTLMLCDDKYTRDVYIKGPELGIDVKSLDPSVNRLQLINSTQYIPDIAQFEWSIQKSSEEINTIEKWYDKAGTNGHTTLAGLAYEYDFKRNEVSEINGYDTYQVTLSYTDIKSQEASLVGNISATQSISKDIHIYGPDVTICQERIDDHSVDLITLQPAPGDHLEYLWMFKVEDPYYAHLGGFFLPISKESTLTATENGVYKVRVTDQYGYVMTSPEIKVIAKKPEVCFDYQMNCLYDISMINLTGPLPEGATFLWSTGADGNGDGQVDTSTARHPRFTFPETPASYTVNLTVEYPVEGCEGIEMETVSYQKSLQLGELPNVNDEVILNEEAESGLLSISATTYSDSRFLDAGLVQGATMSHPILETNPFVSGMEGVWHSAKTFSYYDGLDRNTQFSGNEIVKDLRQEGFFTATAFDWTSNGEETLDGWKNISSSTRYTPYGYEVESKDILGVYSAVLYGYSHLHPVAVAANAQYNEIAFCSFETGEGAGNLSFLHNEDYSEVVLHTIPVLRAEENYVELGILKSEFDQLSGAEFMISGTSRADENTFTVNQLSVQCTYGSESDSVTKLFLKGPGLQGVGTWKGELGYYSSKELVSDEQLLSRSDVKVHSGKHSLKVTASTPFVKQSDLHLIEGKRYMISLWVHVENIEETTFADDNRGIAVKSGNTTVLLEPVGEIIEGWQQVRGEFLSESTALELAFKTSGSMYVDDLRVFPSKGSLQTHVYDPSNYRLIATLDQNNYAAYYFYDAEGNLFLTKKETAEGVMTIQESRVHKSILANDNETNTENEAN